jgi:RNA polymerase sigma-54 factor
MRLAGAETMRPTLSTELRPRLELRPTAALVAYAQLLALPTGELDAFVERELAANPALERGEPPQSRPLGGPGPAPPEPADEPGLLATLAVEARASLPRSEYAILEFVLGSLDDRGLLTMEPAAIAAWLRVALARVERVRAVVRALGPPGLAARDVRECLDAQLEALADRPAGVALARRIVATALPDLAAGRYRAIARRLGVDRAAVVAARDLLRARVRPYPVLDEPLRRPAPEPPPEPELRVVASPEDVAGMRVELAEERRWALGLSAAYATLADTPALGDDERRRAQAQACRARAFLRSLQERWGTVRRVAEATVREQSAFVEQGPSALRPLTRAQVARTIGVHESTVSRAVAGRRVLLPSGQLVALSAFFTAALGPQAVLRDVVAHEPRPLCDDELAVAMAARGHRVARRTVAKYRAALGIPSSACR